MWIKICGIRDAATAQRLCDLGADAIGLNFYSKSSRVVTQDDAVRIASVTGDRIQRVGVFVNHPIAEVVDLARACTLHAVQLHGDELPADVTSIATQLPGVRIYRAWRMKGNSLADLSAHLDQCRLLGGGPAACLVDSYSPGTYGGTGHTAPWRDLVREYQSSWPPLVLAGGLHAGNIREAISIVRPWGVDVASGVESAPGVKDLELVRQFIANARSE